MTIEFCPVCGYDGLEDGTSFGEICSSCGTEFGYSDHRRSHEELRERWIKRDNAQWWSTHTQVPRGWSARSQLRNINVFYLPIVKEKTMLILLIPLLIWAGVKFSYDWLEK